jgi:DNA-binding NarL/FixJ family response regulator
MKRVFIYSSRSLFSSGIKNLLDAEPELAVVGWETEGDEAVSRIQEMKPDVILVVTKGSPDCPMSDGQRFLRTGVKAKIVELNLEDSNVCVYSGEQFTIQEVADLARAIKAPVTDAS